ncbi:toll/interleukin-1 receptor domain-containing protein [Parahaliea mediterranea]|uniref:toll/interleukin-1 receptor domain-containing protein n=1 Tax=Parahaliea mediterranea TaxID=651086 RepID=UPI0013008B5E|nr:toll/interleukin-1 receptor domain-containing protein [Parahaliea mediterranea]
MVKIFISHSESDRELVEPLYKWLQCGLGLSGDDMRCTSVENINVGEASMETLREELQQAQAVIAIVTGNSLRSHWVSIEMGAAWLRQRLHPVRGPGVNPSDLPSPLPNITNAGYCEEQAMYRLLQSLAKRLNLPIVGAAKFELDEMTAVGRNYLTEGLRAWFSLPPAMAASRHDADRFHYVTDSLCRRLHLDRQSLYHCTDDYGYIERDPERLPSWAKDHWKLSRMAVNHLLKGDQDLLDMPLNVVSEELLAELKRSLSKRNLKRGERLRAWFDRAQQWVVEHPPVADSGH